MAPTNSSSRQQAKANSTIKKQPINARRSKVTVASNLPCSFFPTSFNLSNSGLSCTNCSNYVTKRMQINNPQKEMGKQFQCARLLSKCYLKLLKLVATYQVSSHRRTTEVLQDDKSTLPDLAYVEDSDLDSKSESEDEVDDSVSLQTDLITANTTVAR